MGGNPAADAAEQASGMSGALARRAYGIGIPALKRQKAILGDAASQGEFGYLRDAFGASRALMGDAAASGQAGEAQAARLHNHAAEGGGNFSAAINPAGYGAKLANAMFSSRITEATGNVEQMDKTLGFQIGLGQDAGSASMQALGNQIGAIPYMKNYNSTYANVLGAMNAAGAIYGGVQSGFRPPTGMTGAAPGA